MTDETVREQFEKWARSLGFDLSRFDDGYADADIQFTWCGWQAGRRAGMEEAAQMADEQGPKYIYFYASMACKELASAIRERLK